MPVCSSATHRNGQPSTAHDVINWLFVKHNGFFQSFLHLLQIRYVTRIAEHICIRVQILSSCCILAPSSIPSAQTHVCTLTTIDCSAAAKVTFVRDTIVTLAPFEAYSLAVARPKPVLPPVINTCLPFTWMPGALTCLQTEAP